MKLQKSIQNHFFKTRIFKDLLDNYSKAEKIEIIKRDTLKTLIASEVHKEKNILQAEIPQKVSEELQKIEQLQKKEAMRYRLPYNINTNTNPDRKPLADVPFSFLRRMAILYPIARACINRRIRQITQLEWDITTIDEIEDEKGFETQISIIKNFLKEPMGHKTRMRELLTLMVDDILTVDAVCFELLRKRGGKFLKLIPVDPTTIALRVTETGATPEPPLAAYTQYIQGEELESFTTDEMLYEIMGNRTYSPYGLAPLESLILQAEAALRGTLYNLNYFRENNVPEGFITLPEEVAQTKTLVEEWQMWFDALVAGDPRMTHRLKILPGGAEYIPAKKPEDMAFEKFELWLLQQTCAVFDVPPQDIGITYQVNKATGESQQALSRERGLIPLANFIKEIFDSLIQREMGFSSLQFMWRNINPVDRKEEIEIAEKEIKLGALGVDEWRAEQGREPLGIDPYILTTQGPIKVSDFIMQKPIENNQGNGDNSNQNIEEEDPEQLEQKDLKRWRKCIYNDLELKRKLRVDFESEYIDLETQKIIREGLKGVGSKYQAKLLFDQFLDPQVRSSLKLLKLSSEMRRLERDAYLAE